jgi:2-polyprenyl-6-methoxyphenol hydroxylase-like FAD-dependent oxidoreductase
MYAMTRTALIVGAGIGGLATAIALRKADWQVRVFERAASPRELGFGLALAPNGMVALRHLGLADVVLERGFSPEWGRGEMRRPDGTVIKRAKFPMRDGLPGGPLVITLRPALHGALLQAVGSDAIALSTEATGFTSRNGHAILHTTTGDIEGDLLVGADGFYSAIRRTMHASAPPPRSSEIVAVRGAADGSHEAMAGLGAVYYMGQGLEAFLVRASDTGVYWALSLAKELLPNPALRDPSAILNHMLPVMDATFRAVTTGTTEMRCDELFDRDPLPFWSRGVVTLLGDAAHPVLPHTGQGAAQALMDAVALGRAAASQESVESALAAYEQERRPGVANLLRQGRRTARLMRTTNVAACYARELALRAIPVTSFVRFYVKVNRRAGTAVP